MKRRLSLEGWRRFFRRLQWPLAWKGFLRPEAVPEFLPPPLEPVEEPVAPVAMEPTAVLPAEPVTRFVRVPIPVPVIKLVPVRVPILRPPPALPPAPESEPEPLVREAEPLPDPMADLCPAGTEWTQRVEGAAGEDVRLVIEPDKEGRAHFLTGLCAGYDGSVEGEVALTLGEGDPPRRWKVKQARRLTWANKPPSGSAARAMEIRLAGREGVVGRLAVSGYTRRRGRDA